MKIAIIAPTRMPSRRANTIQVAKMAQAVHNLGHEVRLAIPGTAPEAGFDWEDWSRHYGVQRRTPLVWLSAHPWLRSYDYGFRALRWSLAWKADLVYTRLPQAAALASLWGLPTILEVHDLPNGAARLLFKVFLRGKGARKLVVITRCLANDLARCFGAPNSPPFTLIAPDGVDLERYEQVPLPETARRALASQGVNLEPRFTAGYTGQFYSGRGIELLLSLASRLENVNFLIVGGEPEDVSRVSQRVQSWGLSNVYLTGFVPNADLPLYQASCEVLLMPYQEKVSASSGGDIAPYLSPMKLFEYMACGRAILASELPVFREVLSPEFAILLPLGGEQAWVDALQELRSDAKRCVALGEAARRSSRDYSWELRAKRIFSSSSLGGIL